jgi:hypothetical protein
MTVKPETRNPKSDGTPEPEVLAHPADGGPVRISVFGIRVSSLIALVVTGLAVPFDSAGAAAGDGNFPKSPRDFYNDGTQRFRAGKLREAEASLQAAVASNEEAIQSAALFNLGHVRFKQGLDALTQAPDGDAARARGEAATSRADDAIRAARAALASDELDALVNAYRLGGGARKELKAAMEAVKKALEAHGAVLSRWQRASGDFKSACELQPKLDDARFNAEVVDRHIAALVDKQALLLPCLQGMGERREQLSELMKKLKGRIPGGLLPKAPGDEDEDEEDGDKKPPEGPEAGQQEKETKQGHESALTPEEAMRLLESLTLDANRKLPMGDQEIANPKDRKRREW